MLDTVRIVVRRIFEKHLFEQNTEELHRKIEKEISEYLDTLDLEGYIIDVKGEGTSLQLEGRVMIDGDIKSINLRLTDGE